MNRSLALPIALVFSMLASVPHGPQIASAQTAHSASPSPTPARVRRF